VLFSKQTIASSHAVTPRCVDNWVTRGLLSPPLKMGTTTQGRVRWTADQVAELDRNLGLLSAPKVPNRSPVAA
jgi:hypothetical protein